MRTHTGDFIETGSQTDWCSSEGSLRGSRLPGTRTGGYSQGVDGRSQAWNNGSDQKEAQAAQCSRTSYRPHEERWAFGKELP